MKRLYFLADSEENCYTLDYFKEQLSEDNPVIIVYPAKMLTGEPYFWCKEYQELGEVGEGCGKVCVKYSPRNGKNGRCRHSMNCYEPEMDKPRTLTFNQIEIHATEYGTEIYR